MTGVVPSNHEEAVLWQAKQRDNPDLPYRLDVWLPKYFVNKMTSRGLVWRKRGGKVFSIHWSNTDFGIISFQRGTWETDILSLDDERASQHDEALQDDLSPAAVSSDRGSKPNLRLVPMGPEPGSDDGDLPDQG